MYFNIKLDMLEIYMCFVIAKFFMVMVINSSWLLNKINSEKHMINPAITKGQQLLTRTAAVVLQT